MALVGALCACSPIEDGKVGITRDDTGALVALALSCEGRFDGADLYQDDDPNAQDRARLGKWVRRDATNRLLTWNLEDPTSGTWDDSEPLTPGALTHGHTYVLDAVGELQKWSAEDLRFTLAEVDAITTDTVLTPHWDPESGESEPVVVQRSEFLRSACSHSTT